MSQTNNTPIQEILISFFSKFMSSTIKDQIFLMFLILTSYINIIIYPNISFFNDIEYFITTVLCILILFTTFYLIYINNTNSNSIYYSIIILQFNIIYSAFYTNWPFYFTIFSTLNYIITSIIIHKRNDLYNTNAIIYNLTAIILGFLYYCYILKPQFSLLSIEIIIIEVLIGVLFILHSNEFNNSYLFSVPLLQIILLTPAMLNLDFFPLSYITTFNNIDLQIFLFTLYMITIYGLYFKLNISETFSNFYGVLSILLIILGTALEILSAPLLNFIGSNQFNLNLTMFSITFILYITIPFFDTIINKKPINHNKTPTALMGLFVTNIFTIFNFSSTSSTEINHLFLMVSLIMISLSFVRSSEILHGSITVWQFAILLQFHFIETSYFNLIQMIGFIFLVSLKTISLIRIKHITSLVYYNLITIYSYITIVSFIEIMNPSLETNLVVYLVGSIIPWISRIFNNNIDLNLTLIYSQAFSIVILTLFSSEFNEIGFLSLISNNIRIDLILSYYDIFFLLFGIYLFITTYINNNKHESSIPNAYISQALIIIHIIYSFVDDFTIHYLSLIPYLLTPLLIYFRYPNITKLSYVVILNTFTIGVSAFQQSLNWSFLNYEIPFILIAYISGQLLPIIIGYRYKNLYRTRYLQFGHISLMVLFALFDFFIIVPPQLLIFVILVIYIISNPLIAEEFKDYSLILPLLVNVGFFSLIRRYSILNLNDLGPILTSDAYGLSLISILIILLTLSIFYFKVYQENEKLRERYINSILGYMLILSVLQLFFELRNPVMTVVISLGISLIVYSSYRVTGQFSTGLIYRSAFGQLVLHLTSKQIMILNSLGQTFFITNFTLLLYALIVIYATKGTYTEKQQSGYAISIISVLIIIFVGWLNLIDPSHYLIELNSLLLISPILNELTDKIKNTENSSIWLVSLGTTLLLTVEDNFTTLINFGLFSDNYPIVINILFYFVCLNFLLVFKNYIDNQSYMNYVYYISFIIMFSVSTLIVYVIHPILLGISILSLSGIHLFSPAINTRYEIPILQSILLIIFGTHKYYLSLFFIFDIQHIFLIIWSIITLVAWYIKGVDKELNIISMSIFTVSSIYSSLSISILNYIPILHILLPLIVIIFFFAFSNRVRSEYVKLHFITFIIMLSSLLLLSFTQMILLNGNILLIYRFLLDWIIFIPITIQMILYLQPFINNVYMNSSNIELSNLDLKIIITVIFVNIISFLIGAEQFFSIKLMVIAILLWFISSSFTRKTLAWFTSIYTIFVYGYLITQIGSQNSGLQPEYFYLLTIFGFIMLIFGLLNEKYFKGEPLTTSLTVSGSILSAISIVSPLFLRSPDLTFINLENDAIFIQFLVNIVWAILGVILFRLSRTLKKTYLRRLSLGILVADIFKTAYDIFIQSSNPLIRTIGAITLGVVLIYIFYLFSSEEQETVKSHHLD